MDLRAEDVPPQLQVLGQMPETVRCARLSRRRIEVHQPRLQLTDEVQNLHAFAEPAAGRNVSYSAINSRHRRQSNLLLERRQIRVACRRARVVHERQASLDVLRRPVVKVQIQQALIAAIEAALADREGRQLGELLGTRPVDEHARVEAVRPADVRSGGQLFALEQFVAVLQDLRKSELELID